MLRMLGTGIRLHSCCCSASQGRNERNNLTKWIYDEMFLHVFGVTQKNLIIAAAEIFSFIYFPPHFISERNMSLLEVNK